MHIAKVKLLIENKEPGSVTLDEIDSFEKTFKN